MTDCSGQDYKNPGNDCFGNQRYVTTKLLQRFCKNAEYLKQYSDMLYDMTDPEMGARFLPMPINELDSFGFVYDSGLSQFKFRGDDNYYLRHDFTHARFIDQRINTAYIDISAGEVRIPLIETDTTEVIEQPNVEWYPDVIRSYYHHWHHHHWCWHHCYDHCHDYHDGGCNCKFCHGHYEIDHIHVDCDHGCCCGHDLPWIAPHHYEPHHWWHHFHFHCHPYIFQNSVSFSQTFTTDSKGKLSNLKLPLSKIGNPQHPLIIEIRNVVTAENDKPGDYVIARAFIKPEELAKGLQWKDIVFSPIPLLEADTKYSISCWTMGNGYGWYGNRKNRHETNPDYAGGEPWRTMIGHSHWYPWWHRWRAWNTTRPDYGMLDLGFKVTMDIHTSEYLDEATLYFTPLCLQPIKEVTLSASHTKPANTDIKYYVSNTGADDDWHELNDINGWTYIFTDQTKIFLFFKAVLSTTNTAVSPSIQNIELNVDLGDPYELYLRTQPYAPRLDKPVGANLWGALDADYTAEPNTTVLIDLIATDITTETFSGDGTETTFTLSKPCAYPLKSVTVDGVEKYEHYDYTVDYDEHEITFRSTDIPPSGDGNIVIVYNEVILEGVNKETTPISVPTRLDLFQEEFTATEGQTAFILKATPLNPPHQVYVNSVLKTPYIDFNTDSTTKTVTFVTPLTEGDEVRIEYTPYYTSTKTEVAFRASRTVTTNQVYLKEYILGVRT